MHVMRVHIQHAHTKRHASHRMARNGRVRKAKRHLVSTVANTGTVTHTEALMGTAEEKRSSKRKNACPEVPGLSGIDRELEFGSLGNER